LATTVTEPVTKPLVDVTGRTKFVPPRSVGVVTVVVAEVGVHPDFAAVPNRGGTILAETGDDVTSSEMST
jgi:hypothetical protein